MSLDTLRTLSGTATYGGGLIGTAVQGGPGGTQVRAAVGQFAKTWDFGARTGSLNASFDGAQWRGVQTGMPGNSTAFTATANDGSVAGLGAVGRTLAVQGSFFHNPATGGPVSPGNLPMAVGGQFAIRDAAGGYGANGVMVGARRP